MKSVQNANPISKRLEPLSRNLAISVSVTYIVLSAIIPWFANTILSVGKKREMEE